MQELETPDAVGEKQVSYSIRPGYKQTEVGLIPDDWEVRSLGEISDPVRGGSPRPAGDPRFFNGAFIPWLTVAALTNIPPAQMTVMETSSMLTEEGSLRSRILHPNTLIIANSGATLGVAKILGITCCANDGIAALLKLSKTVSNRYLAHFINTRTEYLREVVATGNGQPNLNTDLISDFKVPLPPTLAEQESIAEALGDADALVESLERLLAKKRNLKQAAMQQLLTGKKRLPGFEGEWEVSELRGRVNLRSGHHVLAQYCNQEGLGTPYLTGPSDFPDGAISHSKFTTKPTTLCQKDDILVTVKGSGCGTLVKADSTYCISRQLMAITVQEGDFRFIYYSLLQNASDFQDAAAGLIPGLSRSDVLGQELPFPPSHAEQTAIATVLSDMDAEIAAIEAKIDKARQIKAGMMQELLTGKTRLVSGGPAS
ncbi:restriction endonuclease subunit S [Rhodopirellula europaea]|uniref:restriction endonuclease subunit S n=1 Tax=Rhodopirellula europaea TaxID=1263866 RepID=UPI000586B5C5|nr:restriction endonuclease subunit S [Rhodopirellula europaea]